MILEINFLAANLSDLRKVDPHLQSTIPIIFHDWRRVNGLVWKSQFNIAEGLLFYHNMEPGTDNN